VYAYFLKVVKFFASSLEEEDKLFDLTNLAFMLVYAMLFNVKGVLAI